jgi:hypothetical protein
LAASLLFGQGAMHAGARSPGDVDKFVGGAARTGVKVAEMLPFHKIAKNLGNC